MSKTESRQQMEQDREALRKWWAGDRAAPFILKKEGRDYCVCYLLFQTLTENLRLSRKTSLVWLAERLPFSNLKVALYRMAGAKIGNDVFISPGVVLDPIYPELIELQDGCVLGLGAMILAHEYTAYDSRLARVMIGKDSVIGARAVVRAGVKIGNGCTVGASSFVNKDVPDGAVAGGVPARIIRKGAD